MRLYRPALVLAGTLAAVLAAEIGTAAADNSLAATLARMDQAAAGFKGLSADMKKVHYTAVIKEEDTESGTILVKRPKPKDLRARVEIRQPDPKTAVFEGHKAQIYYPKTGEIQPVDLGKESNVVDQFLLLGFGSNSRDLQSAYSINLGGPEKVASEDTTRIEMVPKDQDVLAHFKKVEFWISDAKGIAVQEKFYEPGGDYTVLAFTNIQINPAIPDSAFNLPKGARRTTPRKKPGSDQQPG